MFDYGFYSVVHLIVHLFPFLLISRNIFELIERKKDDEERQILATTNTNSLENGF